VAFWRILGPLFIKEIAEERYDKENLPAEQSAPQEDPRISRPDAHEERPGGVVAAAREGAQGPFRIAGSQVPGMRAEAFPRSSRLSRRSDYRATYDAGKKVAGRLLVLFIRPNEEGALRLGLTATRRTGNAVVRNRIRRRLREIFRTEARARLTGGGWASADVVLNARDGAASATSRELALDLERLVKRLGDRPA
jgi:ribonuclease P protein component